MLNLSDLRLHCFEISMQEQGDLKLRVRTLESERAFQRVAAVQETVGNVSLTSNPVLYLVVNSAKEPQQ